jgi:hypothetical protein
LLDGAAAYSRRSAPSSKLTLAGGSSRVTIRKKGTG